ncbi:MAG TPA: SDR family NAD(P)-dependent oxidoreductase [Glaciihabitans sp.]|jgi:NAD(P)-dependent dehydrogenase (short-subunit alcohol dehydrogenase family)|nr:SDR family NAD(P)-dependent oxidoreductase [Glaciihabitans sp.]
MDVTASSALITGGASGLGLACAIALAHAGAHVVIVDLPHSRGAELAAEHGLEFFAADVTDPAAMQHAVETACAIAPLRVVVTCAGIADGARLVGRSEPRPLEDFDRVIRINVLGTVNAVRLAAAAMEQTEPVENERGVVVMTSSIAAFDGQVGQTAYAASKAAIAGMTLPLARELAARLVRVVTIAPGLFDTPLLAGLPDAAKDSLTATLQHPARPGRPAEFASLVMQIVSNPMLNGETIRLDGAIRMAPR